MVTFTINDDEREALRVNLNYFQRCVYILGIRPFMDFSTGIVGIKRGISYKSIAEEVYIEKTQGRQEWGEPTKEQVRKAVKTLVKCGLLKRVGGSDDSLIFECVLANRGSASEIRGTPPKGARGTHEGRASNPVAARDSEGRKPEEEQPKIEKRDTPLVNSNIIYIYNNSFSHEQKKSIGEGVKNEINFNVVGIPLKDGSEYWPDDEFINELIRAYPGVDVGVMLDRVRLWNINNPKRRKTRRGIQRHITGFFERNFDKSRGYRNDTSSKINGGRYESASERANRLLRAAEERIKREEARTIEIEGECFETE